MRNIQTLVSPGSPVSIFQNSPFYSPVKQGSTRDECSPSVSSPAFMEQIIGNVCSSDDQEAEEAAQDITNDSDEGIESEEAEDIDGEAFKRLIRLVRTNTNNNKNTDQ